MQEAADSFVSVVIQTLRYGLIHVTPEEMYGRSQ